MTSDTKHCFSEGIFGMITRQLRGLRRRCTLLINRQYSIRVNQERPELDFEYLLNPANLESIRTNIANRKQIGDIDRVHELWNQLSSFLTDKRLQTEPAPLKPLQLKAVWDEFYDACFAIPNRTHPESPLGDESNVRLVETVREKPKMDFKPQTAEEIGMMLRAIKTGTQDISTAAGDKAYFLFDNMALSETALIDYALSIVLDKHKFELMQVPDILNADVPRNCGLVSRTEKHIVYNLKNHPEYCLSGTGEMGVASYLENRTFDVDELPKKFVTVSRCYRPEVAGGKIARGIYRVHEFSKVEMFAVTVDEVEESEKMLAEFVQIQKEIYDGLNLHYK